MTIEYVNRTYRITYGGVALVENALEDPRLIQISVVSGTRIMLAPMKEYGIGYLPNGEYRSWALTGYNTRLNRIEKHFIYARLDRDSDNAMILFSVNDYAFDGSYSEGEKSEDYYYVKIGSISETDTTPLPGMKKREITFDYGYLATPADIDSGKDNWKKLFEVTADDLIRPLKRFASFVVQGSLRIIGKIVLNDKVISDVTRQGDEIINEKNDEAVPTTAYLSGKFTEELRKVFLNKDRSDQTAFLQQFLGGLISTYLQSPKFLSGGMGYGFTIKQNEDGTTYAEVDKLLVRMKAIFQSLEIMKTELAGASFMFNASGARMRIIKTEQFNHQPAEFTDGSEAVFADGSRAVFAGTGEPFVRCWFVADDGETAIENRFRVGNLVRSQTFNIKAGVHENVSNRFWWREVVGVGKDYIDIAVARCAEGSDLPAVDDVCVQFGDLNDIDYQSAIVLSAYGEGAPYITMYQGINSYSLTDKDVFTIGYDKTKKECFVRNYGRMYVGDRARNRYFDFDGKRFVVAADEIRLGGRKVEDVIIDKTRITQKILDATAFDENKYYPVTFNLWTGSPKVRISLVRTLDGSFGVPSYASHAGGFDVRCVWTTNADGWGTADLQRNIEYYSLRWVKPDELVVGDIGQMSNSSNEYIYVRGGSRYKVIVEGEINTDIILHTDTYTANEQTLYVRDRINNIPVPSLEQTGIDIYNKTVKVTADNFYVSSTGGTPIAVFTIDKNGNPILKAENIDVNNLYVKHLDGAKGSLESGSIGGFELANGRIGTIYSADSSYGLSITNTDFHIGNSNAMVFVGPGSTSTNTGTSSAVRIESSRIGKTTIQLAYNDASIYSAGLRIKSTGGSERKYGVLSELPSLGSAFIGTRLSVHEIRSVGQGITMDLSKHSVFLISSYIGDRSINLPSESQVCDFFGLPQGFGRSLPSDFAVEFTIKCTGPALIRIMGVYNANEGLIGGGYPMRAGDSLHLLLMKQGGFRYHCLYYNTDQ